MRTATRQANKTSGNENAVRASAPGAGAPQGTWRENPETLELLELLDDLVFDAIADKPSAFNRLAEFWPAVLVQLDPEALAESREQYLRHALAVWTVPDGEGPQDLGRAAAALDVLCLLFPETE